MRERMAEAGTPDSIKRAAAGGVVDIEFLIQMHALRHGGAEEGLRQGPTTARLRVLRDRGHIEPQRAADLLAAYRFLLSLESKIRIVADRSEDRLPEDEDELRALAARLGYVDTNVMRAEESLREEYEYHRGIAAQAFSIGV